MAKISDLPRATGLDGEELFPVVFINDDEVRENRAITASSLALAIKTLEELASIEFVEETINEILEINNYATLADLIVELSKKADSIHKHPEYSEEGHVHDFNDLTNVPDLLEYVKVEDFNKLTSQLANTIAETQTNTANIEIIVEVLNNLPTSGEGDSTESGHTHSNYAILETITLDKILKWDTGVTKVSELENDLNYATQSYVANKIAEAQLNGGGGGTGGSGIIYNEYHESLTINSVQSINYDEPNERLNIN